jgi:transposase
VAGDQKKVTTEGRTLVYVDEAGFYLLPAVVRTYAPVGQTPILRAPCSYDRLSVISGITPTGRLLLQVHERAIRGAQVVTFLKHLLRHIPGKLLILWDGASIHRCQAVKDFLAQGGAARIHLEALPAYAPDLNPDEGIWRHLKYVELKNVVCQNRQDLRYELRLATMRLRQKAHVIPGCVRHTGLTL